MRRSLAMCSALALLWLSGCKDVAAPGPSSLTPPGVQQPPGEQAGPTIPDPHPVDVGLGDGTETRVQPEPRTEPPSRSRRRMDLDQLSASMRRATGGIGWTEMRGGNEVDLFADLSATLGKPDYIENTIEDLEPSALFLKFLDDAARSVCSRVLAREMADDADPTTNTFFVHASPTDTVQGEPARVEANLRALLLRFHGRNVAPGAPELQPWTWLMQSVHHVKNDPVESWRAVCVGLINHPDFYSY